MRISSGTFGQSYAIVDDEVRAIHYPNCVSSTTFSIEIIFTDGSKARADSDMESLQQALSVIDARNKKGSAD